MDCNTSPLQKLDLSYYGIKNQVYVKRDDLIHPIISGNKWRKLKYNLKYFNSISKKGIVSIGGAYSSHILALSYICKVHSIKCVLLVRGEQTSPLNDILKKCQSYGAIVEYINRNDYKNQKWIKNFCKENSALGHMPSAKDVASLCLFLASDEASSITGQNINLDCGVFPQ